MNLKTILVTALLFVILMSAVSFGVLTYVLYKDDTSQKGDATVKAHIMLFYISLAMHLLTFGLGVGVFFKA